MHVRSVVFDRLFPAVGCSGREGHRLSNSVIWLGIHLSTGCCVSLGRQDTWVPSVQRGWAGHAQSP